MKFPAGNVVGTLLVTSVLKYGYEYGMLLNSILSLCGGALIFVCLITHPDQMDLDNNDNVAERGVELRNDAEGGDGDADGKADLDLKI